jgi:hypothetical protein
VGREIVCCVWAKGRGAEVELGYARSLEGLSYDLNIKAGWEAVRDIQWAPGYRESQSNSRDISLSG